MKFQSIKILILMIVCNLAAIAGYYFLFQYIVTQTQSSSDLINTINLSEQKNSHLSSLRTMVKDTEEERQQLSGLLLSNDAEVSFIEQVETLAKKSGLESKTDSVSSVAGIASTTNIFNMQIETTGSWSNTMYFLNQIENLPYDIHIEGSSLNKQDLINNPAGSAWMATFNISVTESA